jgi:hypothetical protein
VVQTSLSKQYFCTGKYRNCLASVCLPCQVNIIVGYSRKTLVPVTESNDRWKSHGHDSMFNVLCCSQCSVPASIIYIIPRPCQYTSVNVPCQYHLPRWACNHVLTIAYPSTDGQVPVYYHSYCSVASILSLYHSVANILSPILLRCRYIITHITQMTAYYHSYYSVASISSLLIHTCQCILLSQLHCRQYICTTAAICRNTAPARIPVGGLGKVAERGLQSPDPGVDCCVLSSKHKHLKLYCISVSRCFVFRGPPP